METMLMQKEHGIAEDLAAANTHSTRSQMNVVIRKTKCPQPSDPFFSGKNFYLPIGVLRKKYFSHMT